MKTITLIAFREEYKLRSASQYESFCSNIFRIIYRCIKY